MTSPAPLLAPAASIRQLSAPAWRVFLLVAGIAASGCGASPPRPAPTPAEGDPSAATVIGWALGAQSRAPAPPTADRLLLALPTNKPIESGARVTPHCLKTTSFLPAPAGDSRIFFLVGGQVHVREAPGQDPVPLGGQDPALGVSRLLAADAAASPLEIMVVTRPNGAPAEELWLLTVGDGAIQAQRPITGTGQRGFTEKAAFFRRFAVPRCLSGGRRCLAVSADEEGSEIVIEPTRGAPPEPFETLANVTVLDATWASDDGASLYLLVPCS